MVKLLGNWLTRCLKVPPQPEAPFGTTDQVRIFRAGPGYLRYRLLLWALRQAGVLLGIVLFLLSPTWWDPTGLVEMVIGAIDQVLREIRGPGAFSISIAGMIHTVEWIALAGFLLQLPVGLTLVFLDYQYRWYLVTDCSLRIREGLVRVHERTMTFSNIQNVAVRQGPIQRWFGISDLEVRSAGGGESSSGGGEDEGTGKDWHLARFRGIDNAGDVYGLIRRHLRTERAGNHERDGAAKPADPKLPPGLLEASRRLLYEIRSLRAALTSSQG